MSKELLVKIIDSIIPAIKEFVAYNHRAAQGMVLTAIFFIALVRYISDSGNLFELFCAWLCGYIYVRYISHVESYDVQMEPMTIDFTLNDKVVDGLSKKVSISDKTVETLYSVVWPAVMLYVGYMILVDIKRGASNGNDL